MFKVGEQNCQRGLARWNKNRRPAARQVCIIEHGEAFAEVRQVIPQAACGFFDTATMIDRQVAQSLEAGKLLRLETVKRGTESGGGFEQVTEQLIQPKGVGRRLPFELV